MTEMPVSCSALWVGKELGKLHAACLRSFGAVGIPITLYVYERPIDVPSNVELADAAAIIPREKIFRHKKTGSFSHFADVFRCILLKTVSTLYVDVDVYCLRPIPESDYIFGWEDGNCINNAVLKYPPDSELAERLFRSVTNNLFLPPWQRRRETLKAIYRHFLDGGPTASHLDWGVLGPSALTYYVKLLGLTEYAVSSEAFYPVHWTNVEQFLAPNTTVRQIVSPRTLAIHLYNEAIRRIGVADYAPTSPIMEMLEGRVEV